MPTPQEITLHTQSRQLEIAFDNGHTYLLPFELLRVYSPSAEVKGHAPGQEVLQTGKRHVTITDMLPVGHYGVQPVFSDGHDSGIYTWDYLYWLGESQDTLWLDYETRLAQAGASRDPAPDHSATPPAPGCGTTCPSRSAR